MLIAIIEAVQCRYSGTRDKTKDLIAYNYKEAIKN